MLICRTCNVEKPLDLFPKNNSYHLKVASKCKQCSAEYAALVRNPCKEAARKYNISTTQAEFLYQTVLCEICGNPNRNNKRLCIDHCHSTGKIRGMLCDSCNSAIGLLKDSQELLEKAIKYLNENS